MKGPFLLFLSAMLAVLLSACSSDTANSTSAPAVTPGGLSLSSPAFENEAAIPSSYTCQGEDISPPLQWTEPPDGTHSFALIVDDPDAPGGTWVHWVVYNIPPGARELPESVSQAGVPEFNLPVGSIQGQTSFRRSDYGGPCPPSGTHRYYFRLYAVDIQLERQGLDKAALLEALQGHILATGELMGTYKKQ